MPYDHYLTNEELAVLIAALTNVLDPRIKKVEAVELRNKLNSILQQRSKS